jgi:DNA-binding MarR family transcriptional regulator
MTHRQRAPQSLTEAGISTPHIPAALDVARGLGVALRDASQRYTKLFESRAGALDLTLNQCRALVLIERNEGITQRQLADLLEVDAMALVRIIDRVEAQGWVRRMKTSEDRRARRLAVTSLAHPALAQIRTLVADINHQALAGFTSTECAQLLSLLSRLYTNLLDQPGAPEPFSTA